MTKIRRIRKRRTKRWRYSLCAGLIFFILPLACNGQNSNNNLKSKIKTTESTTTRKAGGVDFTAIGAKRQGREVPQSLRVEPGAKHPVWKTQSNISIADQAGISQTQGQPRQYVPHEVLVKFNPDTDPQTIARIQEQLKLETIRKFGSPNLFLMKITDGATVEAVIKELKTYQAVKYAEPNYVVKANQ